MNWFTEALVSSIGRKFVMAITGLFLISFLFVHLAGNLQLFAGDEGLSFNQYTLFMTTSPLIRIAEIILIAGFAAHIYTAYVLTERNKISRPVGYVYQKDTERVTWYSKNMGVTGSIILIFLIMHLYNFWYAYKFGDTPYVMYDEAGEKIAASADTKGALKDMYHVVETTFRDAWWYSILYILSMVLLAAHLNHGFQSAFRTLGLAHKKYSPLIEKVGLAVSVLIPLGFALIPIYFWLIHEH
jgi:succinate dehydrogenase / fumarate reductase cytochrome b subunit